MRATERLIFRILNRMSNRTDAAGGSTSAGKHDAVDVFQNDGVTYILEPDGAAPVPLHFAHRSAVLRDIPEDQGSTVLPFSRTALKLWQEAVPCAAARDVPSIQHPVWGMSRLQDLRTVVQVRRFARYSCVVFKSSVHETCAQRC